MRSPPTRTTPASRGTNLTVSRNVFRIQTRAQEATRNEARQALWVGGGDTKYLRIRESKCWVRPTLRGRAPTGGWTLRGYPRRRWSALARHAPQNSICRNCSWFLQAPSYVGQPRSRVAAPRGGNALYFWGTAMQFRSCSFRQA